MQHHTEQTSSTAEAMATVRPCHARARIALTTNRPTVTAIAQKNSMNPQAGDLREHHETEHREKWKNQQSGCDPIWSTACTKPHSATQERDRAGNINDANISGRKKPETKHNPQNQDSKTDGNQAFFQVALLCNVIPTLMRCIWRPVRIQTNRKRIVAGLALEASDQAATASTSDGEPARMSM